MIMFWLYVVGHVDCHEQIYIMLFKSNPNVSDSMPELRLPASVGHSSSMLIISMSM